MTGGMKPAEAVRKNTVCSFLTRLSDTQHTTHSTYHRRFGSANDFTLIRFFERKSKMARVTSRLIADPSPFFTFFQMNDNAPNHVLTTDSSTSPCFSITLNANKSHSSILEKN